MDSRVRTVLKAVLITAGIVLVIVIMSGVAGCGAVNGALEDVAGIAQYGAEHITTDAERARMTEHSTYRRAATSSK